MQHTPRSLASRTSDLSALRGLAKVYAEVSSMRMRQVRDGVVQTRGFMAGLQQVFSQVAVSYRREIDRLRRLRGRSRSQDITFLPHNGKAVAVLISANTGLYGDIVQRTFDLFCDTLRDTDHEATIIGRLGQAQYLQEFPGQPYTYFDLPDNQVDEESLSKIVRHLVEYQKITVYYGRFVSVVQQTPDAVEISPETAIQSMQQAGERQPDQVEYYFEPTMEQILVFFEKEMFAGLLKQVVKESQLAKYAARMVAMDQASERIGQELEKMDRLRMVLSHQIANRKQLNQLAAQRLFRL